MKKRITAIFAVLAMLVSVAAPSAFAEESYISISTADELIELAYSKNKEDFKKNYRLENDIDMSAASDKRPMKAIGSYSGGSDDVAFEGDFDGAGYKISNLATSSEALFGYVGESGRVENLVLERASVHFTVSDSSKYPAALVSLNKGSVENCFSVKSTVVSDLCSPAGGLVGTNFGTVKRSGVSGGSVSFGGNLGTSHGGFVGNMRGGSIEECYSTAAVDAKKWAGGFVGKAESGIISDCYALGNVSGSEEVGGFAGALAAPSVIENVYVANDIIAQSGGGLVGGKGFSFAALGTVENGYYNKDTKKPIALLENGGTAADNMKTADFASQLSDNWTQSDSENDGYPYLLNAKLYSDAAEKTTVSVKLADYDSAAYEFKRLAEFETEITKQAPTVKDIMDAAAAGDLLTYAWGENEKSTQIVTINGITPQAPDGWMFAVNGKLSAVGAGAAAVSDGDELLWFVGTPENGYNPPVWDAIDNNTYITINSADEFVEFSKNSDAWDKNYKLACDVDLSGVEFLPIGNEETPFTGIFDGCGFEIRNLKIIGDSDCQNLGLFGVIKSAKIKNVKLINVDITGGSVIGALVGRAAADETGASLIASSSASGKVTATGYSFIKQTDVGGLVGVNDSFSAESGIENMSAIDNCIADIEVSAGEKGKAEAGHVGGFVGLNKGTVLNSAAHGNVLGGNTTGGFAGINYGGSIYMSSASGNVSGAYSTGGFAGSLGLFSVTENCSSTGDVTAVGEGGSYFGGFAGTMSGKAKNCVSAGTLSTGWSYNGGFAGSFDGVVWSYNDNLRSIKNCFANSYTADGAKIKALGSYIGGVHAPSDMAAEEIGVDKETAERKIKEISAENKLAEEAAKYKDSAAVPATVREGADITDLVARLNINNSANADITLSYKSDSNVIGADDNGYTLTQKSDSVENVVLTFKSDGATLDKNIAVTLSATAKDIDKDALLENIAKAYSKNCENYWQAIVLAAYDKHFGASYSYKDFAEKAVESIRDSKTDTSVAMGIIALRALGYDPSNIISEDGTKIDAYRLLKETKSSGNNGDAYKLLAYSQGDNAGAAEIKEVTERLLSAQIDGKGWSNNEDAGIDPDTTGAVILGLSSEYSENADVKKALDSAIAYLSSLVQADGNIKSSYKESNYGTNANTSAICAIGLEAVGVDVSSDERFSNNSVSLLDGIMSFAAEDGFFYDYSDKQVNRLATEQAALALIAAEKHANVFDFSKNKKDTLSLKTSQSGWNGCSGIGGSGNSGTTAGSGDTKKENAKIYFTLVGDSAHETGKHEEYKTWIDSKELEISDGMSAADVVKKILESENYSVKGLENGYISEITAPDGTVLGEYTNGQNSGWLYSVNGNAPTVGINEYKIKDGDKLKLYYVDDWSLVSFKDVKSDDWFAKAAEFAAQNGYIAGSENGEFMPNTPITRAMVVTILGRYDGVDLAGYADSAFSDVVSDSWYGGYVAWAADKGIVSGMSDEEFAPNDNVTREQLAAILFRYAKLKGVENKIESADDFSDSANVSDWAREAVLWAKGSKIISGMGDGRFAPTEQATRAQFAVILMGFDALIENK